MTITVGTDTYISLADANTYFENETLKNDAWDAICDDKKEILLKLSTKKLDLLSYIGVKTESTQALEFPRSFSDSTYDGYPKEVEWATCEEALAINENQNNKVAQAQASGIKSMSLGNESYTFVDGGSSSTIFSSTGSDYINKWLRKGHVVC